LASDFIEVPVFSVHFCEREEGRAQLFDGGTIFCRMTIDNFLGSHYIAVSAVAEEYEPCFWIAWDDVTENESGYVFESCKGVLSVLD